MTVALLDRQPTARRPRDPRRRGTRASMRSAPAARRSCSASARGRRCRASASRAIESMRIVGDTGATLDFSAYELGERALAWIVEERALRAALLPAIHVPGIDVVTGGDVRVARVVRDRRHVDARRRPAVRRHASSSGADGLNSWVRQAAGIVAEPKSYGQQGVVANFDCERRASRLRAAVVSRRRRRARVAAAARAPHLDRVVGARRAGARACSRCRTRRSPRAWPKPASARSARCG